MSPMALRRMRMLTNAGNGAMLLISAPLQFRIAGLGGLAALRGLLLSGWLSAIGAVLLVGQLRISPVRHWLRRHFRFATTASGRTTLQVFAATIAFSSGSTGCAIVGLLTCANAYFGWHFREVLRMPTKPRPPAQPKIAAPSSPYDAWDVS